MVLAELSAFREYDQAVGGQIAQAIDGAGGPFYFQAIHPGSGAQAKV